MCKLIHLLHTPFFSLFSNLFSDMLVYHQTSLMQSTQTKLISSCLHWFQNYVWVHWKTVRKHQMGFQNMLWVLFIGLVLIPGPLCQKSRYWGNAKLPSISHDGTWCWAGVENKPKVWLWLSSMLQRGWSVSLNWAKVTGTLTNMQGPLDFVTTSYTIRKLISNEVEKQKVTKPRHPEMVSYGDVLNIPTQSKVCSAYYSGSQSHPNVLSFWIDGHIVE